MWKGLDGMKDVLLFYSGMVPENSGTAMPAPMLIRSC
jgi:hypothetical protein